MPYHSATARKYLSAREYELFRTGNRQSLSTLSPAALRQKIVRTRRLRDKYDDLYRRQRLTMRARSGSKGGRTGVANERTQVKQAIFSELLQRFEARAEQMEQENAVPPTRRSAQTEKGRRSRQVAAPKVPKPSTRSGPPQSADGRGRRDTKPAPPNMRTIHAHVRAAGRRAQARRDAR